MIPLLERIQADESLPALARELFAMQAEEYVQLSPRRSQNPTPEPLAIKVAGGFPFYCKSSSQARDRRCGHARP